MRWLPIAAVLVVLLLIAFALAGHPSSGSAGGSTPSPTASPRASAQGGSHAPGASPVPAETGQPGSTGPTRSPATSATPAPEGWLLLSDLLAMLPVADEHRAGYDRALFPHWIDANGDGCNTRAEVLIAEAVVAPHIGPGCKLSGGRWVSPYDGLVLTDPADLQIDHLVPLAEAWDSGAWAWTTPRRQLFANDLDVSWALIAVSAASNESKSDRDPADWLPPAAGDLCSYVSAWIADKARWGLSVDQREEETLAGIIPSCPGARMPFVPAPEAGPPPASLPASACSPAYPTVCIPPPPPDLNCADIPYRNFTVLPPDPHHFDGDHDGIGCEG